MEERYPKDMIEYPETRIRIESHNGGFDNTNKKSSINMYRKSNLHRNDRSITNIYIFFIQMCARAQTIERRY